MDGVSIATANAGANGLLDRARTVAGPGFNRWLVPPAALAIHLCIGMAYGFSVFWRPLTRSINGQTPVACAPGTGLLDRLFTTSCDWLQSDVAIMYTLFFVFLGSSAALFGGWLERSGPRKAAFVSTLCWCGGLVISALGIYLHQLWMMWLGSGVIGGIGLGLGYISPVSTLIKWFPDRRGMATGMAIMGFGGGALIGAPLADTLMNYFKTPTTVGAWETFLVMAAIYSVFMFAGTFGYRVPPNKWSPEGWTKPEVKAGLITSGNVHLRDAHKTPQFWLIWVVLCMNVSAGIGVIAVLSPMIQEIFGGSLVGKPGVLLDTLTTQDKMTTAAIGAGFVGLISLFNIGGRFFWASISDKIGRKVTYGIFLALGGVMYASIPWASGIGSQTLFVVFLCVIASMYGGGFATIPAYLADMFGTQFVGAIHGRLLTAWSTAGILGPILFLQITQAQKDAKLPSNLVYDRAFYVMAGLMAVGFVANLLIRPVADRWYMQEGTPANTVEAAGGSFGIGRGGLTAPALLAWACVGLPLAWGIYIALSKALVLFR